MAAARFSAPNRAASEWIVAWLGALSWCAFALLPSSDGGAVRHEVWSLGLGAIVLAAAAVLSRPRGLLDTLGLSIGAGFIAGLALCNDPFAWPLLLAPLLAFVLAGRGPVPSPWRDRLRGAMFFAVTAAFVAAQGRAWPAGFAPWPSFEPAWQAGWLGAVWIDAACAGLVAWLVLALPRTVERRLLAILLTLCVVLRAIDPRFAAGVLAPGGCGLVCLVLSLWRAPSGVLPRRALALASCAALLAAAEPAGHRDPRIDVAIRREGERANGRGGERLGGRAVHPGHRLCCGFEAYWIGRPVARAVCSATSSTAAWALSYSPAR
jgi:hypothetical protein